MNQAVEEAVATNIAVVRDHRQDIKRLRALTNKLAVDLEDVADCRERIKEIIQAGDEHPQTRNVMLRAVSLPGNAGVLRDLTTALSAPGGNRTSSLRPGRQRASSAAAL